MTENETKPEVGNIPPFLDSVRFITALAKAYQRYGGYTFETDLILIRVIRALGLNAEINATPNSTEIALWFRDESQQTMYMAMTRDTDYDLTKLAKVNDLIEQVVGGQVLPTEGLERLHAIESAPLVYGKFISAFAFVLCGASFAVILGASWLDVFFGGLLGLVSFVVAHFAIRSARVAIIMELLATAIIAVLASGIAVALPGLNPLVVTVCAVIWFVPGFGLTIAPSEIIYRNTLSGIIYLTNALVVALKLLGGTLIGIAIAQILFPIPPRGIMSGVPLLWTWLFVPVLVIGLAILFRVLPKNLVLVVVASWLTWAGVQVGNPLGNWVGAFFGAIILTVFAKFSATKLRVSSSTIFLPGIMILVPGYAFLRALYIANSQGSLEGIAAGYQVVVIILAIIAGVFVGDAIGSSEVLEAFKRIKLRASPPP